MLIRHENNVLLTIFLLFFAFCNAQSSNTSLNFLNTEKIDLSVKGYYRFIAYNRHLNNLFGDNNRPYVFRTDDEFNSPTINLELSFNTKNAGFIKTQLYLFEPFYGITEDVDFLKLNRRGVSIELSKNTKLCNLNITAGGINFLRFSDFTLSSARQVRTSLFDRNAWTYVWPINVQSTNYMQQSDYIRAADFGKRQVSGVHLVASDLPNQFNFELFYGKTPFNVSPLDNIIAFKLNKDKKLNHFGLGFLRSNGIDNLINGDKFFNNIFNSTYNGNINEWKLNGELAISNYFFSSNQSSSQGFAAELTVKPSSRVLPFPLFMEGYYIAPSFVNIHSSIVNGSVKEFSSQTEIFDGVGIPDGARPYGGVMTPMHIKSNNRYGLNLNSEFNIGKFNINLGNGFSREIINDTNLVSFFHKVNGLYLSRVERFQSATGPNNNLTTFFRGYYENVMIDSNANSKIKKSYNVFLLNLKYQTTIFNKQFFIFYLGEYHSVQKNLSPIPVFTENAFLRNQFHEIDAYLEINQKIALISYFGREFILGNDNSGLGDIADQNNNFNPRNGIGKVIGVGFDYSFSAKSCFYFRFKKVSYNDKSFNNNNYNGYEATAELKIFF
jgi:hypothetical protein